MPVTVNMNVIFSIIKGTRLVWLPSNMLFSDQNGTWSSNSPFYSCSAGVLSLPQPKLWTETMLELLISSISKLCWLDITPTHNLSDTWIIKLLMWLARGTCKWISFLVPEVYSVCETQQLHLPTTHRLFTQREQYPGAFFMSLKFTWNLDFS